MLRHIFWIHRRNNNSVMAAMSALLPMMWTDVAVMAEVTLTIRTATVVSYISTYLFIPLCIFMSGLFTRSWHWCSWVHIGGVVANNLLLQVVSCCLILMVVGFACVPHFIFLGLLAFSIIIIVYLLVLIERWERIICIAEKAFTFISLFYFYCNYFLFIYCDCYSACPAFFFCKMYSNNIINL